MIDVVANPTGTIKGLLITLGLGIVVLIIFYFMVRGMVKGTGDKE